MAKYRILRGFAIETGRDVFPGDVVDLTPEKARIYLPNGKLVLIAEDQPPAPPVATGKKTHSDPSAKSQAPGVKTPEG